MLEVGRLGPSADCTQKKPEWLFDGIHGADSLWLLASSPFHSRDLSDRSLPLLLSDSFHLMTV